MYESSEVFTTPATHTLQTATRLDGKSISKQRLATLQHHVTALHSRQQRTVGLAMLLVGDRPDSLMYTRMKVRTCEKLGLRSFHEHLPQTATLADVRAVLDAWNADDNVHGILVQLPLPDHLDETTVLNHVAPSKDVDGFHEVSMGRLVAHTGNTLPTSFVPCTPRGILTLLDAYDVPLKGKHVVCIGNSRVVGLPVGVLLMHRHATVTFCHKHTTDLPSHVRTADVVIACCGVPELVRGDWLKRGAVVVDVGINVVHDEDGKKRTVGDVCYDEAVLVASAITPVPGGVGPMTIAALMEQTVMAAESCQTTSAV